MATDSRRFDHQQSRNHEARCSLERAGNMLNCAAVENGLPAKHEFCVKFTAFVRALCARGGVVARASAVRFSGDRDDLRIFAVSDFDAATQSGKR